MFQKIICSNIGYVFIVFNKNIFYTLINFILILNFIYYYKIMM